MEKLEKFIETDDKALFEIIGASEETIDQISTAPYSYWRETFRTLIHNKVAIACFVLLLVVIFFTIFGPMMKYYSPTLPWETFAPYEKPSADHWFGTNVDRYDIWSIVWSGSRLSLELAVTVSIINAVIGLLIGSIWGFFPKIDPFMIEVRNFVNNVPSLLLNMMFMQIFTYAKVPTFIGLIIVLCIFGWLGLAATLRNNIIIIRNRDFNVASRTLGSKPTSIIVHNLLPFLVSIIVTVLATAIPAVIDSEVSLAFFNLTFKFPDITLGTVIASSTSGKSDWLTHPHVMLFPSMVIIILTVAFYYIGFSLADATDPRTHR